MLVLLLSLLAGYITNRWWISEVTISVLVGAAIGPILRRLLGGAPFPDGGLSLMREVAHLTLAIAVMGAALRLPKNWFWSRKGKMGLFLLIGLPAMWLTGSVAAYVLLTGAMVVPALLIGAVVAPTDPVVSYAIVGGNVALNQVDEEMRLSITAESGANDGVGMLFVMLPFLLLRHPVGEAVMQWATEVVLKEILLGIVLGVVAGELAGRVFAWAEGKRDAEHHSLLAVSVALAVAVVTFGRILGLDGILAAFCAGVVFNRHTSDLKSRQQQLQGAISRFFDLPVFLLFGALLPWGNWIDLGWRGLTFAFVVVGLRRLPWWLLFHGFDRRLSRREVLFSGWFGPIGVAAIFYALLNSAELNITWLWPATSLAVAVSVVLHGVSATPLAKRLGQEKGA